jgi:hypothetical protein
MRERSASPLANRETLLFLQMESVCYFFARQQETTPLTRCGCATTSAIPKRVLPTFVHYSVERMQKTNRRKNVLVANVLARVQRESFPFHATAKFTTLPLP